MDLALVLMDLKSLIFINWTLNHHQKLCFRFLELKGDYVDNTELQPYQEHIQGYMGYPTASKKFLL